MTEKQLKRYSARARRRRRLRRLTLMMLVLAAAFLLIDRNFRPLVFSLAEARSAAMATRALNGALTEALEDGVEYDDLMNVRMDDSGQVSLLSANTMRMNALADRAATRRCASWETGQRAKGLCAARRGAGADALCGQRAAHPDFHCARRHGADGF